jgi:hypothetical protein
MPAPIETKLLGMILVTPIVLAAVAMLWAPILIVLSIYLVGMVLHKVGMLGAGAGNVSTMAEELLTGLEGRYREVLLADRIPIPASGSFTIGITQTDGVCPMSYRRGHVWFVRPGGRLSRPLCKPGVAAISSALERATQNGGLEKDVSCACPLGDQDVTFTVRANPEAAVPV